jgi:uncharacterized glyoxalase superfamily protein PhnB
MPATSSHATAVRYRDAAAAVDWLCKAFGFEKQTVVTSDAGAVEYAQLTCGRTMLMLAPVRDSPLDKLMKQPDEIGGAATQSCYIVVEDADAHHTKAKDAGAEIVLDLQDDDFGGRGYSCRDPEGHLWMFGTYDPWQGEFPEPTTAPIAFAPAAAAPEGPEHSEDSEDLPVPVRGGSRSVMLAGLAMSVAAVLAVVAWVGLKQPSAVSSAAVVQEQDQEPPAALKAATEAQERAAEAAEQARALLERERLARASADKASADAQKRIGEEQRAREAAERGLREARAELERERVAKAAVELAKASMEKANTGAAEHAATERRAREAAEKAAKEAREQLERERNAMTAAEMAKEFALGRADEERLAREAAERTVEEMRGQLDRTRAGKAPSAPPTDTDASKRLAKVQQAFEAAQRQAAEAQRAREAAEKSAKEAREQLEREQAAKAAAWKVVGQLTRQLRQAQGGSPSGEAADGGDDAAPKKARPKKKKAADE